MKATARLKLTVLFAVLFTALAAILIATSYSLISSRTTPEAEFAARQDAFEKALEDAGVDLPDLPRIPPPDRSGNPDHGGNPDIVIIGPGERVSIALQDIQDQTRRGVLDDLLAVSILAFVLSALFAIPLAWWLSGRVLHPLDDVVDEANALSATSLSRRLPNDGPNDEFRRLKTAFNGMLDRLESAFDARQRFAADASHELRTPLAVMRAKADNLLDAKKPSADGGRALALEVREQVDRSESLVESLLTLARADDVERTRTEVDLADVTADAASRIADSVARAGATLDLDLEDAPTVGDEILLVRMVENALDNAVKHGPASGGSIRCMTATVEGFAVLTVSNASPKIAGKDIPRLFERFERGATRTESKGHGLGLPIIRRVAESHGGTAIATPRRGGGLVLEVRLPGRPV